MWPGGGEGRGLDVVCVWGACEGGVRGPDVVCVWGACERQVRGPDVVCVWGACERGRGGATCWCVLARPPRGGGGGVLAALYVQQESRSVMDVFKDDIFGVPVSHLQAGFSAPLY